MTESHVADERGYPLVLVLARKPFFCCGCLCLAPADAKRIRRVFKIVRAVTKSWVETNERVA